MMKITFCLVTLAACAGCALPPSPPAVGEVETPTALFPPPAMSAQAVLETAAERSLTLAPLRRYEFEISATNAVTLTRIFDLRGEPAPLGALGQDVQVSFLSSDGQTLAVQSVHDPRHGHSFHDRAATDPSQPGRFTVTIPRELNPTAVEVEVHEDGGVKSLIELM